MSNTCGGNNFMSKKQPTPGESLAKAIISEYEPKTVEDMQNAFKDVFGPMFEAMLNGEMENHLGYDNNERAKRKQPIAVTATTIRPSKHPQVKSRLMFLVIERVLLNRRSCQSGRPMFPRWRVKCLPCMPVA